MTIDSVFILFKKTNFNTILACLRWRNSRGGRVPPRHFSPGNFCWLIGRREGRKKKGWRRKEEQSKKKVDNLKWKKKKWQKGNSTVTELHSEKFWLQFNSLWTGFETLLIIYFLKWRCSGRSTQVPFWRKWIIDGFEVVIGQKIFWPNFGRFGPFPVGVTQGSSGGQIFKMLQMTYHVYQIIRQAIRITKIYGLLCVGCMVYPKVKWGQIFINIRFAWMIYQIIPLSLHIPKMYTFKLFELLLLE